MNGALDWIIIRPIVSSIVTGRDLALSPSSTQTLAELVAGRHVLYVAFLDAAREAVGRQQAFNRLAALHRSDRLPERFASAVSEAVCAASEPDQVTSLGIPLLINRQLVQSALWTIALRPTRSARPSQPHQWALRRHAETLLLALGKQ